MTINEIQDEIIEEFSAFDDWMDKYALLIELGNSLAPLDDKYKTESNLIEGCQSRVWLQADYSDGLIHFQGESDAVIVKGIVSLLIKIISGHTPDEILNADLYFVDKIGLKEHLSPTRSNGLVAMDTESFVGKEWVEKNTGKEPKEFRNGDHTTTLMRTAKGKVVEIQHNVMTPQPYNRLFKLTGTKGYATKYPTEEFAIAGNALKGTDAPKMDNINAHGFLSTEQKKALMEKYRHPILDKYAEKGRHLGHGGMDYVMDSRLVYCLQHGLPLDMDVYDMAEWCALGELGAISMDNNCAAVTFPDFTRGYWNEVKGYTHAYATPEQEAAQESYADAYTAAQKEATAKLKLWELYDAAQKAEGKTKTSAIKKYERVAAKLDNQIEKILKAKSNF
jgi:sulfur transfer protein SufE